MKPSRLLLLLSILAGSTSNVVAQTDATSAIFNPGFEGRSFGGWCNHGFQTQTNNEFPGKNYKAYAERWVSTPNDVANGYLVQTVQGLPNGQYRLTVAAQNIDQGAVTSQQSGAFVIANPWAKTMATHPFSTMMLPISTGMGLSL